MPTLDLEAEYNNRARVPEHGEIFARWTREAAAYRDEAVQDGRAELGCRTGAGPRQFVDLFAPAEGPAAPLALFIHGGYWRSLEAAQFSHMARGLNTRGVAVAVSGYDLCPQVSIAEIIAQTRQACVYLWRRFGRRILAYGHSAGGHLAACMVATDWKILHPDLPADLVPAAYSVSGLFDLTPLVGISMNQDLRLDPDSARRVSPLLWDVPPGRSLDALAGALESSEFLRQSQAIAEGWRNRAATRYEVLAGANHFTSIDPLADPASPMVERLAALSRNVQATAS
jgi:arylformamidase